MDNRGTYNYAVMVDFAAKAKQKIDKAEAKSQKAKAVKPAVCEALNNFCGQNEEFARAVVQGESIDDCLESTVKGCGNFISDLEVYKRAARFFFPGADVKMTLTIDLGDGGYSNNTSASSELLCETAPEPVNKIVLSLDSLLDF